MESLPYISNPPEADCRELQLSQLEINIWIKVVANLGGTKILIR
jgi:hypothetical protein